MASKTILASALLLSGLALAPLRSAAANPGDWPGWQGANRDGKSTDKGLLKSWPAGGPKLLWTATGMGQGFARISAMLIAPGVIAVFIAAIVLALFMAAIMAVAVEMAIVLHRVFMHPGPLDGSVRGGEPFAGARRAAVRVLQTA